MISPKQIQIISSKIGTPVFIYDEKRLQNNFERIINAAKNSDLHNKIEIYVAYFTNSNPHLFKILNNFGAGILLQTQEEYHQIKKYNLDKKITISPSFLSDKEIDFWVKTKADLNLASLDEIKHFVTNHKNIPLNFRIDPTLSESQRTGVKISQFRELKNILQKNKIEPASIHVYIGTGSSLDKMADAIETMFKLYKKYFPRLKKINMGGGFSFDYSETKTEKKHFDWNNYFKIFKEKIEKFSIPKNISFAFEPGRDIFADSGIFLLKIKRIIKNTNNIIIATDGSYVYMPSATIRTRQHNLTFLDSELNILNPVAQPALLSGCTTLSRDFIFPGEINIPNNIKTGDYIIINDTGAYCATQHMEFLNKKPCPEILISSSNNLKLISKRGEETDKIRNVLKIPSIIL